MFRPKLKHKVALTWMKIVQSSDNNIEIVDHKFLVSGHSILRNDRDLDLIEMRIRKANYSYIPEHYYELIELCRKKSFLSIFATKFFWLKIQWMRCSI